MQQQETNTLNDLGEILLALKETEGISPNLDKALLDVQNDLQAMLDLLQEYSKLRADLITKEDFWISYNIYRSKRGGIEYED